MSHRTTEHDRTGRRMAAKAGLGPTFEPLEGRRLFSGFSWTAEEVLLLEYVNRARSDPHAEAELYGIDLEAGLTSAELARMIAQEPLALNEALTMASRLHSLDMAERDFFDHTNPDGDSPTDRAREQTYGGTAGENIAAGFLGVEEVHIAWLESIDHRRNVLSLHTNFTDSFHYDEFGAGVAHTDIGPFFDYHTQMFGYQGQEQSVYLLGVVYDDVDGNDFYSLGEGAGAVRIDVASVFDTNEVIATYTTGDAGNYQISLNAGTYHVTFTDLASGLEYVRTVLVGSTNVKVDGLIGEFRDPSQGPVTPPDDHANAGDWLNATEVTVDATIGGGAASGLIDSDSDTDLFRFVSPTSNFVRVSLVATGEGSGSLTLFSSEQLAIGFGGASNTVGISSELFFNIAAGEEYFVEVSGEAGGYVLVISDADDDPSDPVDEARVTGSGGSDGRLTLTTVDDEGRPVVLQQDAGGDWVRVDLLDNAGGPGLSSDVVSWMKASTDRSFAAARSSTGLVLFEENASGDWSFRNLTAEIDGSTNIVGELTVFTTLAGATYVAGLDATGDLVVYHETGRRHDNGRVQWRYQNIAEDQLRANGMAMPEFVGETISYVTPWNGLNIAGLDSNGDIQVIWWAPGVNNWVASNLSAQTGAPELTGGLTVYQTPWQGINLAGVDSDGNLTVTWWVPQFGGRWVTDNLTAVFSGPQLEPSSVASYVTSWGGLNVAGLDDNGDVLVYWWAPGLERWNIANLSALITDSPISVGKLTGVTVEATGDINVLATTDDGDVIRYVWEVGGSWVIENISEVVTDLV